MANKIISYCTNWVLFRLYILFPFLRPSNIILGKHVRIDLYSNVIFNKKSNLKFGNNIIIINSKLIIINSEINLDEGSTIKNSILNISNSTFKAKSGLLIQNFNINLNETNFLSGIFNRYYKESYQSSNISAKNGNLIFGDNVNIDSKIILSNSKLVIGNNTFINYGTEIRCFENIIIGNNVFISYDCLIFDTNTHSINSQDRIQEIIDGYPNNTIQTILNMPKTRPIIIGDNVWLGMRVSILKGSKIGNDTIVGLNSVVSGLTVGKNCLVAGNPGKILKIGK